VGYTIEHNLVRMQESKVEAIREWPTPTTVRGVQEFVGLANYYRVFVKDFSKIAIPLTNLTKKGNAFEWTEEAQKAFEQLKEIITSRPVLIIPDPNKPYEVETDASDDAMGGTLIQRDEEGRPHPVAFVSKKFSDTERRYGTPDQELMAIITAFKEWRHYLSGTKEPVIVRTDHKNLTSFTYNKQLSSQ